MISGYVTCILDDSKVYANHSKKKFIDLDDVKLAVKLQMEKSFTNPPPRDVLLDVARTKNNVPLPFIRPSNGLRLPPDRFCLSGTNYKLKSLGKKGGKGGMSNLMKLKADTSKSSVVIKRPGPMSMVSKTQTISSAKPVYKISACRIIFFLFHSKIIELLMNLCIPFSATSNNIIKQNAQSQMKQNMQMSSDQEHSSDIVVKNEPDESSKRKREDDDYDVP